MTLVLASPYFVFLAVAMLGWLRLSRHVSVPHWLLEGLTVWVPPPDQVRAMQQGAVPPKAAAPADAEARRRLSGKKKRKLAEREGALARDSEGAPQEAEALVLDGNCLRPLANYGAYDGVVFAGALAVSTLLFAEFWSCMFADGSAWPAWVGAAAALYCLVATARMSVITGYCGYEARLSFLFGSLGALVAWLVLSRAPGAADTPLEAPHAAFMGEVNAYLARRLGGDGEAKEALRELALPARATMAVVALAAGAFAGAALMPAMRFARCLRGVERGVLGMQTRNERPWVRRHGAALATVNLFLPLAAALLWVAPLTKEALVNDGTEITPAMYDSLRLALTVAVAAYRVAVFRLHAAAYAGSPLVESGSRPSEARQRMSATVAFLPTMAVQYLGPALVTLLLALTYKRVAGVSWGLGAMLLGDAPEFRAPADAFGPFRNSLAAPLLSFALFWSNAAWFAGSVVSLLYVRHVGSRTPAAA